MNPPDSEPSGREFGEVASEVRAISNQLSEMQRRTSAEYASVMNSLREIRRDMNAKASKVWVREIDERTDKLKSIADEGSGAAKLARVAQGAIGAGIGILGYVIGQGGGLG